MQLIMSPNSWLEKKVDPFDFDSLDAAKISNEMIFTMLNAGGIGLAANQVGINAQIFVMKPYLLKDKTPLVIINPVLEAVSVNMLTEVEGCLSHPGLFLKIKRPRGVVANYLDINGKECTIELFDFDARCFLHEYDHLQGIEFTDRVSKLKLSMARKKQKKKEITYG